MRISRDEWGLALARVTAERGTCCRRAVGCVLVDAAGHVIATGYNGVAQGMPHCNEEVSTPVYHDDPRVEDNGASWVLDGEATAKMKLNYWKGDKQCVGFEVKHPNACEGATAASGTQLDACQAIHAEQNALLQCRDVAAIETAYITCSPCITCIKLLLNTGCQRIVFGEIYPSGSSLQTNPAVALWLAAGRSTHFITKAES